ncbi:uncharacterized protein LOC119742594 [Patiria miniata]|uniref:Methyltransferase type 11 domain-containing protein n=1 Tax=Patiria miniata TaxID=46514 RepID=A0A914BFC4_PATMI|nr:uncharacterized protein LOC119742594 [Patiria miniata]
MLSQATEYLPTIAATALLATSGVAVYSTYKLLTIDRERKAKDNVYETAKLVNEYLVFHYGTPSEVLRYDFGPTSSLDFARRVADECLEVYRGQVNKTKVPKRALDIGCAVGRTAFELARDFEQVIGIDYSQAFVDTCCALRDQGSLDYSVQDEGDLSTQLKAVVDPAIDCSRVQFQQGDACSLPLDLGQFGCVVAANLTCRLQNPYDFLNRLPNLVAPGGILMLTTPCTWLAQFTPKSNWLGGYKDKNGQPVTTFDTLKKVLGPDFDLIAEKNMQFFIRETARKNQWSVAHATIWIRKE